ncbi:MULTISPECIES: cytochrome c biogenesis protein CcsA [unclassified Paenibacillus]|uniref:cytochrome c biogenesis protein CcsA n=1 Tax=unclassified Paenibacillus TaxID=185978 RepID=UPI001C115971|nr:MULTISPECIES: cytochrome c biogenesis protein CcsA [unclassified Paenibacillus]MBU5444690.1 cytochrome c biogenesis protein CcsA [Paenibacillus sp. MSJ-34]CAH0119151.1 hypothetical protein PAE9249_01649 [Paenibacillus sp. CECT 9249]
MVSQSWIYDVIIYMYALSLLFFFPDFVGRNPRSKRMGTGLLAFVWVLQTALLVWRVFGQSGPFELSRLEFMFAFSWVLVTVSLAITLLFRIDYSVFLINIVGFAMLVLNLFSGPIGEERLESWEIAQNFLVFHVALAVCSFAALTVGTIFAGMYVYLHRKLKGKQWSDPVRRLPSLEKIDRYCYLSLVIGTPLLIMSLVVAVASVFSAGRLELLLDLKVLSTLAALILYLFYFLKRFYLRLPGNRLAYWTFICYAVMVMNVGINALSTFHHWMGE